MIYAHLISYENWSYRLEFCDIVRSLSSFLCRMIYAQLTSISPGLESCDEVPVLLPVEDDLGPSLLLTSIGSGLEFCDEAPLLLPVEDDLCPSYFLRALVL